LNRCSTNLSRGALGHAGANPISSISTTFLPLQWTVKLQANRPYISSTSPLLIYDEHKILIMIKPKAKISSINAEKVLSFQTKGEKVPH